MKHTIFWAGDSTVKENHIETYPQTGLSQGLPLYLKDTVCLRSFAQNGKSTKNFIAEGYLEQISCSIQKGDFFFIEFGHNDWFHDPLRHTTSFGDYQENLAIYIQMARDHGAYPVLITPLYCRFLKEDGSLKDLVHYDYPDAMIALAKKEQVPYIDLCQMSKELLQETDLSTSNEWFMNLPENTYLAYPEGKEDDVHLRYAGAVVFAGLIAQGLVKLGGIYGDLIR